MATSTQQHGRPKVGVGVFVTHKDHPGCVLVGIRKNSTGEGLYALPGGHLEFGESWEECGKRETEEETGLILKNVTYCTVVNAIVEAEGYHYITLFVKGEVDYDFKTEPENREPHKCKGWDWIHWDNIPPVEQLFRSLAVAREQGFNLFS